MDSTLLILLTLKNNWSITGSGFSTSDLIFTTNWFNENLATPQVTITFNDSISKPSEMGPTPAYYSQEYIDVNVWYRPSSESNTSYGFVKNAMFQIKSEIERILRVNNPLVDTTGPPTTTGTKNILFSGFTNKTDTSTRPVTMRSLGKVKIQRYN